ncbi:MAG TPA: cohesin domain-containing protein, partial [Steroidobacteraceae bacterium]|nr:cohesin domain-containing protein [Steroidobacteraceae bacterium]
LFGTHHSSRDKDEIVLSITPRIIRMQPRAAASNTEFWYGSESRTRTSPFRSDGGAAGFQPRSAAPAQSAPPAMEEISPTSPMGPSPQPISPSVPAGSVSAPLSGPSPPQTNSITSKEAVTPGQRGLASISIPAQLAPVNVEPGDSPDTSTTDSQNAAASDAVEAQKRAAAPRGSAPSALTLDGPASAKVGDEFQVVLQLSTPEAITHLRSQLRFEPSALQLISATAGDVFPAAAGSPSVDTKSGGAQLDVVASPEDPVQGAGSVMIVRFKALAPRPATQIAAMLNVVGSTGGAAQSSSAQPLKIAIAR